MSTSEASAVQEVLAALEEEITPVLDRLLDELGQQLRQCHTMAIRRMIDIAEDAIYHLHNEEE
jgi:hypothetical protein